MTGAPHQAAAKLRASELRFQALFDAEPECVKIVAPDGSLVDMNPAGLSLLGARSVDQVRSLGLTSFIAPEYRAPFLALHTRVIGGQRGVLEFEATGLDGVRRRLELHAVPMPDPEHGGTMVLGVTRDITRRTLAEAALEENARRMQALSRRVLEAQEIERRNVAHELHEELGQTLAAIKINLQSGGLFKDRSQDDINAENLRHVEAALEQVRRLALALRPSMLDDLGLAAGLRWISDQSSALGDFELHFDSAIGQSRLAPDIETACFRIAQEALTNVARHAAARNVKLRVQRDGDMLVMVVEDDGRGFDVAAQRARADTGEAIGLLGMQERATLVGGSVQLESAPGLGTSLRLHCPWR